MSSCCTTAACSPRAASPRCRPTRRCKAIYVGARDASRARRRRSRLEFEGLVGGYGGVASCAASPARSPPARCSRHRPQRRGQEHADEAAVRPAALPRRQRALRGPAGRAPGGLAAARSRHELLPAGAPGVRRAERARQPHADAADRGLAGFAPLFARFPILAQRLGQHAGTLSGGEKKILSFVRGLAEAQPLLLLDEPSEGVQWENVVHMADADRRREGGAARRLSLSSRTWPSPS